jgi:hypothetical protein
MMPENGVYFDGDYAYISTVRNNWISNGGIFYLFIFILYYILFYSPQDFLPPATKFQLREERKKKKTMKRATALCIR